jgi:hypothetical protein
MSREIAPTRRSLHVDPVGAIGESVPDGGSFPGTNRAHGAPRRRRDWGRGRWRGEVIGKRVPVRTSTSRRGRRIRRRAVPSGPSTRGGRRSSGRGPYSKSSSRSGPCTPVAGAPPDSGAAVASAATDRKRGPPPAAAAALAPAASAG